MAHDPARRLALDVLCAVRERGAYANLLLPQLMRERRLPARDRAFATELTYGALRAQGSLDASLDRFIQRAVDPAVRDALRLGAYQMWRTRVPARAAVSTTVDLVRSLSPRAAGFANAVLRRVSENPEPPAPAYDTDPRGHLAVVHSHPRWIVDAFADALGDAAAQELEVALAADDARPQVHLVARRMAREELLADAGPGAEPGLWSARAVYLPGGDPGELSAVRDGRAAVQDEGSQLVALALASAAAPGLTTVDLASGPGGKAALLAALGMDVTGLELHETRARLVARSGVAVAVGDGRVPPFRAGSADRVLLDAPCSGLGALRRRPEARWRRTADDIEPLALLQEELLRSALTLVRPGGLVAYATCSPHPRETIEVMARVSADPPVAIEPVDVRPLLPPGMADLGRGPAVQLWPHRHGTDAMFLALLRRTG
ncbi:MAG TPA: transcription antitermination factor NusB [Frankiaceae bacterium]|jgi:16S rRNA (cytosine967-C5)-methyltransferase|nr:transcription antitermination factor NusB [Frankiaceae bacterium]